MKKEAASAEMHKIEIRNEIRIRSIIIIKFIYKFKSTSLHFLKWIFSNNELDQIISEYAEDFVKD